MKVVFLVSFVLSLIASQSEAVQITRPKLIFGPSKGTYIGQPFGGQHSDVVIAACSWNATTKETPLFRKNADGNYDLLLIPEIQVCSYTQYYASTNGKWIILSGYNGTSNVAFYRIYSIDAESNLVKKLDGSGMFCYSGMFTDEDTFMGSFQDFTDFEFSVQEFKYQNGAWINSLELLYGDVAYNTTYPLTSTSFPPEPQTFLEPLPVDTPILFSKQVDGEWALSGFFDREYFTSYESFDEQSTPSFNGNDTLIFLGAEYEEVSSGSVYIAQYVKTNNTWKIVKRFHAEDFVGLENEYTNTIVCWAWTVRWVDQNMALLMSPYYPLNFNGTDFPYGGSVAMIYRDDKGVWRAGGSIQLEHNPAQAEIMTHMTTTQTDIIMVSMVGLRNDYKQFALYSYPLCFPQPIDVTCATDLEVASCDESAVLATLSTTYQYDDVCGEALPTMSNFAFADGKVTFDLQFERVGLVVGQCSATIVCPKPPQATPQTTPSTTTVSGATGLGQLTVAMTVVSMFSSLITM